MAKNPDPERARAKREAEEQTPIRLAMLANGYTPVPLVNKRPRLKRWNALEVDEAEIRSWPCMRPRSNDDDADPQYDYFRGTGCRLDGDLLALDVDVNDADAVAELWEIACEIFGDDFRDRALVRFGGGSKECWLARLSHVPPRALLRLPKYEIPGVDGDHTIEIFTSASTRQIGAYGWHTVDKVRYRWLDNLGPAEVRREDLPVVTLDEVIEFGDAFEAMANWHGWAAVSLKREGGNAPRVYDLTHDQVEELRYANPGDRYSGEQLQEMGFNPAVFRGTNERKYFVVEAKGHKGIFATDAHENHLPTWADPNANLTTKLAVALAGAESDEELGKYVSAVEARAKLDPGFLWQHRASTGGLQIIVEQAQQHDMGEVKAVAEELLRRLPDE